MKLKPAILFATALLAVACGSGDSVMDGPPSGFEELSDDALQDRSNACRGIVEGKSDDASTSGAGAQVCNNIKKECMRRRREGRYPC